MRTIIILLTLFLSVNSFGQRFRILSENTGNPIESVAIFNTSRERAAITDSLGYTRDLPFLLTDTLVFQHPSYNTVLYPFTEIQEKKIITLSKKNILFDEFVISASKSQESRQILPYSVSVQEEKNLIHSNSQTSADLLQSTGNILIQKSQAGGGSPILRGFEANKILLVVDGVRMNNAIYRNGHLQNSITIDNAILSRTEVIFGPGSLIYGSDALGGVIHYYTKDPQLSDTNKTKLSGGAYGQYSTANNGKVGHVHFNLGRKKTASLTSITYKDFGLIRTGSNRNLFYGDWGKTMHYIERVNGIDSMFENKNELIQQYTDYNQIDILQKFKYSQSQFIDWIVNLQYSTSSDIHRLDMLNDYSKGHLKYSEYYYGPQNRLLASVKNLNRNDNSFFTNASSIFAYQRIDEDRITRQFRSSDRLYQLETVNILSLNFDFLKIWDAKNRLSYGYDLIYNHVGSGSYYESLENFETRRPAETRYPSGGSNTYSSSVYGSYKRIFSEELIFNGGLRYNYTLLNSVFSNPALPFDTTTIHNGALTGSLSLVYHPTSEWQINSILSTGYRNPNVDDYGKIRAKNDYIIIPNPDIKPEYTYNAELGASRVIEGFLRVDLVGYYTLLTGAIVRTDFTLNGMDSLSYDGDMYKISANYNAQMAHIYGASLNVVTDFYNNVVFKGSLNITKGRNLSDDVPLGHIPPIFGRVSITYDYKKFRFESYVYYNGWKYTEDFSPYGEDNESEATVFGYPAWWTLNVNTSYRINDFLEAHFTIENILDQFYKPYASGVSAPGRNFIFTLRTYF